MPLPLLGLLVFILLSQEVDAQVFYQGSGLPDARSSTTMDSMGIGMIQQASADLLYFRFEEAQEKLQELEVLVKSEGSPLFTAYQLAKAELAFYEKDLDMAAAILKKMEDQRDDLNPICQGHFAWLMAGLFLQQKDLTNGFYWLERADSIYHSTLPNSLHTQASILLLQSGYSAASNLRGDTDRFRAEAHRVVEELDHPKPNLLWFKAELGSALNGDHEVAIAIIREMLSMVPADRIRYRDELQVMLGTRYYRKGEQEKSVEMLELLVAEYEIPYPSWAFHLDRTYEILASYYRNKDPEKFRHYVEAYLSSQPPGQFGINNKANAYNLWADFYRRIGQYDSALYAIQKAHEWNSTGWTPGQSLYPEAHQIVDWYRWLMIQVTQASIYFFMANDARDDTTWNIRGYECMVPFGTYAPYMVSELPTAALGKNLVYLLNRMEVLHGFGETMRKDYPGYNIFLPEYYATESSRSLFFQKQMLDLSAREVLPDSLKYLVDRYEARAYQAQKDAMLSEDERERKRLESIEFQYKLRRDSLLAQRIGAQTPLDSDLFEPSDSLDFDAIQRRLAREEQLLISYYYFLNPLSQPRLKIYLIGADTLTSIAKTLDEPLDTTIAHWSQRMRLPFQEGAQLSLDDDSLALLSHKLYQILLEPVFEAIPKAPKRLAILPYKDIEQVPMDVLLSELPQKGTHFQKWPYVFRTHAISYAYHTQTWLKEAQSIASRDATRISLVMTPWFDPDSTSNGSLERLASRSLNVRGKLSELNNQGEGSVIASYLPRGKWLGDTIARIDSFKAYAPLASIIHLGTHAIADPASPRMTRIAFYGIRDTIGEGFIYYPELQGMDLDADLVTLSACSTAGGAYRTGEGRLSITRVLRICGAKSVVASIWPLEDNAGSEIFPLFYKYLAEGESKDLALQHAKMEYLDQAPINRSHPGLWSSVVLYGNTSPLDLSDSSFSIWLTILGSGLLLFLSIWYFRKGRSR